MKIIDCFGFYNELDLLYYRLKLLYDVVDVFVICESTKTFAGNDKELFYENNKSRYQEFESKIVHIINDELISDPKYAWYNENHQRNYLNVGIQKLNLSDDDQICISDLDEIPDPLILGYFKYCNKQFDHVACLEMDYYYFNLTTKCSIEWVGFVIQSYRYYKEIGCSPQKLRMELPRQPAIVGRGGWHLSYFGDPTFVSNKIQQFAHQEYNYKQFTNIDLIEKRIQGRQDLYGRQDYIFENIPIEKNTYLPPNYDIYLTNYC